MTTVELRRPLLDRHGTLGPPHAVLLDREGSIVAVSAPLAGEDAALCGPWLDGQLLDWARRVCWSVVRRISKEEGR